MAGPGVLIYGANSGSLVARRSRAIERVYAPVRPSRALALRLLRPFAGALAAAPVQAFLKRRIRARAAGPSDAARAAGFALFWGEAEDGNGRRAAARQKTPSSREDL
ncbi:MAG TPA: hypothetical protein VFM88_08900 [Vicinamibacteria bacterium]|nr:hypothetical protein [Vicinamibacteria bacterium]